ncbi:MAG: protein kinase [Candidatus Krumholzibacteria bacterium]|nr:protein kinase [Candidatus Krumholzibacteria bacterium]
MIGRTVAHYRILEALGEGGMGVLYRAEDTRLGRLVALKLLRGELLDEPDTRRRLLGEARAAAALDHPNICAVYDADVEGPHPYIAMALLEGETLAEKVARGPLPVDEALRIATQVGHGLEAAHGRGVVHRDVKTSNIMVTAAGRATVLDFGLCGLPADLERSGILSAGTAAYMSPEQARGDEIDHRSDIWSLGVCLYEMLTGRAPFPGEYAEASIYAILNQDPKPLGELRGEVPRALVSVVERALAKDPDERYQSLGEMLTDLESPLAVFGSRDKELRPSVAVLPFADMSPERDQEYFCDGIAEEIINALTRVEGLEVVARTSSFAYKGRNEDAREIGRKLGVDALLEGSVRKAGKRLRVTGQFVDVATGFHIWSGRFDRDIEDVFAIQDEIAQTMARELQVELSEKDRRALERRSTKDVQAYDYYLRGRSFFGQPSRQNIGFAIDMFARATEEDPDFARAYAGLADCHSWLYWYFDHRQENVTKALAASERALELDALLAEAHAARGLALSLAARHEESGKELDEAIRLNPRLFEAYYYYARTCFARGEKEKAAQYYERACEVDPENTQTANLLGFTYRALGRMAEAEAMYHVALRNLDRHLALNPGDVRSIYLKSATLIELGRIDEGLEWTDRAYAADPNDPYTVYGVACSYSRSGRIEEALDYLERSVGCGFAHAEWIEQDVDLDPLREHPRFAAIMASLGGEGGGG